MSAQSAEAADESVRRPGSVSIIIPAFNAAATLPDLLTSLARLSISSDEIIVVDDASVDDTRSAAFAFGEVRVVSLPANGGAGAARNAGAKLARGEILLFLDADTEIGDPDLLTKFVEYFAANPGTDAVSGAYLDSNGTGGAFAGYLDAIEAAMRPSGDDVPAPGSLNGSLCAIRRHAFFAAGGFPEGRRNAVEDIALGLRLSALGYTHRFNRAFRVRHRQPGVSNYLAQLIPRSRHYAALLSRHHRANEMMGGLREGLARLAYLAGCLGAMASVLLVPAALPPALAVALIPQWRWIRQLLSERGPGPLPGALVFHALSSTAIAIGIAVGGIDRLRYRCVSAITDASVVVAYLKSLLTRGSGGYLIHFLTHRCNAHCRHCFDTPNRETVSAAAELSLAEIEALARSAGPLGHVSLTGGEPFLRDDLPQIYRAWTHAGVRSVSLSTNGSMTGRLARLLPGMLDSAPTTRLIVTISVDGIGVGHDRARRLPGLYERVEESFAVLADLRQWHPQLRVHACLTLTAETLPNAAAVIRRLTREAVDQIEVNRLRGKPADETLVGVSDSEYRAVEALLPASTAGSGGLARLFAWLDRRMFRAVGNSAAAWPDGPCLAGRRLEVVLADGRVLPCEMLANVQPDAAPTHNGFVVGDLRANNGDLGAIRQGAPARRIRALIEDSHCRCSFECAIFASTVYRPWRLLRPQGSKQDSPESGQAAACRR